MPIGGATGSLDGWRWEKRLAPSSLLTVPLTMAVAAVLAFASLGTSRLCSSYLLGGTRTSWAIPPPRRSESRLLASIRSFLRIPEILPLARSHPLLRDLSPSSEAPLLSF